MNILNELFENNLIETEGLDFIRNPILSGVFGSQMYGTAIPGSSDFDILSLVMPPIEHIFPHKRPQGYIQDFKSNFDRFKVMQMHNIQYNNKEYDVNVFSVVKFFLDTMGGNNNNIAFLFAPKKNYMHLNDIGSVIIDNRQEFLTKYAAIKFTGFAHSQIIKIQNSIDYTKSTGTLANVHVMKESYTALRLMGYAYQMAYTGTLDPCWNNDNLLRLRLGGMSNDEWFDRYRTLESEFNKVKNTNYLPEIADEDKLQKILLDIIEMAHGVRS